MNVSTKQKTHNNLNNDTFTKTPTNLVCFSHLRWDFVYQRPQHLLSRFATRFTVFFVEEPIFDAPGDGSLTVQSKSDDLWIVTPHLREGLSHEEVIQTQKNLLDKFLKNKDLDDYIFWYYTPMALAFSGHLTAGITLYDCMDELSMFKNPPAGLHEFEEELLNKADIVFTGGQNLYEFKKDRHHNIFTFHRSIYNKDFHHARNIALETEV